jgi:hypothetical protein
MAKYYELGEHDIILTVFTDSMDLYKSRLEEMRAEMGEYSEVDAAGHHARYLLGESTANLLELSYEGRRRVHNLKYFTWVEQQGKTFEEIQDQWYKPDYWTSVQRQIPEMDALIESFNQKVGLI